MLDVGVFQDSRGRSASGGDRVQSRGIAVNDRLSVRTPRSPPEPPLRLRDQTRRPSLYRDSHDVAARLSWSPWPAIRARRIPDILRVRRPECLIDAGGP